MNPILHKRLKANIFIRILTIMGLFNSLSISSQVYVTVGDFEYYGSQCLDYFGTKDIIKIPTSYTYEGKEYEVRTVGYDGGGGACFYGSSVSKVIIPKGIAIVFDVFENCPNLKEVEFQNDNPWMFGAFGSCPLLEKIIFTKNVLDVCIQRMHLKKIQILNPIPPKNRTNGCYDTLCVPSGTKAAYEMAGWRPPIVEFGEDVSQETIFVYEGIRYQKTSVATVMVLEPEQGSNYNVLNVSIPAKVPYEGVEYEVIAINKNAFAGCNRVQTLTLPDGIKTIGQEAFKGCSSLQKINIPKAISYFPPNIFDDCTSLKEIDVSANESYRADENVIYDATMQEIIRCPPAHLQSTFTTSSRIKSIREKAFYQCKNLVEVIFTEGVSYVGENALADCRKLESVTFPASLTRINKIFGNYNGQSAMKEIHCKNETTPPSCVEGAFDGLRLGNMILYVPTNAAREIYKSVSPWNQFRYILKEGQRIAFTWANLSYGHVSEPDHTIEVTACENHSISEYVIPETIEKDGITYTVVGIGENAFDGCTHLQSVTIPASINYIRDNAFANCTGLKSVHFKRTDKVPEGNESILTNINQEDLVAYVPKGTKQMYMDWGVFNNVLEEGEETPSDPVDPSDATLKSLSYKIGEDGEVISVPGFRPDVFYYQISYDKSQAGSAFYAIAEANNPKATVTTVRDDALGRGFVSVSVESEDGKESRTYSIFGVETGDEDKCYLVLNLGSHMGDHMTLELNGKAFRGDAVYKAVPGEQIVGKLVPDKGYRLPGEITEFDGFMMGFIQRGETDMYASDGTIRFTLNGHKLLYASAQEGEEPSSPSDATLKSLSYKIGEDGEVIPVPGFQPDVFHYQISYDKSLTGSTFYAVAEANNPKATVDAGGGDLGKRSALILVESEDKSEGGTYSIFGVESGDEDKRYLVFNLGDHLAFLLNGKEFRGNDVYKGVPGEEIVGKLVPDRGYRLPTEISVHDVFMSSIQRGETDLYTYDGTIRLTLDRGTCIYASAQEGEETDPPSVGSKLTDEPFVYEVLPENRLKLLHPTLSSEEWRVSSCDVPASVRYRGVGYQVTEIGSNAFEDYTNLKIITLSEGLLSIGAFAFDNCGLTRLSLPASVTFIGDEEGDWDLFGDCPNLQAVTVAEGSKTYSASDSILYNKDRSRLILCPPACPHSEVRVPDEVKEIMPYAFADSKNVAGLTLPAGLEKIGEFAFASSALGKEKSYIRCLGEQPVTFEDTEFLLLLSSTQAEEDHLLASNNGKYPCTLYVPAGTKAAYEAAFFWKNFPIQEELPSGDVTISGGDGKIEVEDENGEKVEVEDGVIGNDDLPTVIERISIDIRASSSETTKLVFKQVTVGDGQVVTQETTTTTEIKEETNVSITIEGENVLGKLVNNGIAALLTGSKDGSLSNTVVVNYNTFTSETKLVSKVEGTAPLDVSDPENKTVVAGSSTTLVASTTVESSFNLTFVWERWVDGAWQKVDERKYENLLRSSADKQEDKLTVSAADAGLYRCRITNTVGDVSTTLITTPAEVKLKSSDPDPTPTPSETYYDIILPELTGATTNPAAGKHTVKEGDSFSFTLTLDADYDQSKPEVKAGDEVLVADANGKYTIANVRGDLTITITGITLNTPTANAEVEQPVKVWAEGTTLHIYTEKRETIRLYTFSGQLLKQMDNAGRIAITGLPEGNYLIRIGNRTWKIAL